ncbi:MAG: undecaprenyl/decaprenyl-phosphate alpha-N-acetylglucosaminyl 1-phosphate transferase [Zoogloea sp.]|uniref:undecaprenyl/decaprenyl-phosphate alpha-N-acetylglucosaminyl 1-phosphate transferase n=1 Tax=Zoogloea sp. TaxID=49181 RepID=UPI002606FF7D|nr:undecaprenyl/decaprenyl-phosphate alpha-N-acetylglucosaminyl 1-phosphate transferase [Zoogloea sp.]MDD3326643.1 undecaprenyl/decaprenyl-phosphate alpha-N-acetylglucosaminyl 1-phosphate transferase [Zoogloea sp.]
MFTFALFLLGFVVSAVAVRYAIIAAHRFGVVDKPGGHKAHDTVTPFVGGVGVLAATLCGAALVDHFYDLTDARLYAFVVGILVMWVTGFSDDILNISFKIRLVIQAAVGLAMVYWGGVALHDLGHLASNTEVLSLGFIGVPLTLIATMGAINALNMIDGIDGLSGSISIVSLLLIAFAVFMSGDMAHFTLIIMIAGGVAGFLYHNLRYLNRRRARCFLGDNGSMQLGFIFAWLLTDFSQMGDVTPRAITPITTLWLFAVPLIDTLCVMLRRIWMGRSPFHADRNHLHHLFLRAGFRVQDTVLVLAFVQLCFGAIGLGGMYAGADELTMLIAFIGAFALCFYILLRPWRLVPLLRRVNRVLGFTSAHAVGVHLSGLNAEEFAGLSEVLNRNICPYSDFRFSVYRRDAAAPGECFGVIELLCDDQDLSHSQITRILAALRREIRGHRSVKVRQFVDRKPIHDRRLAGKHKPVERRLAERRSARRGTLIYRMESAAGEPSVIAQKPMMSSVMTESSARS